jgi:hypothetical protein
LLKINFAFEFGKRNGNTTFVLFKTIMESVLLRPIRGTISPWYAKPGAD